MKDDVIILDHHELQFVYNKVQIIQFRKVWNNTRRFSKDSVYVINKVAEVTGMLSDNVLLLALDQIRKGKID